MPPGRRLLLAAVSLYLVLAASIDLLERRRIEATVEREVRAASGAASRVRALARTPPMGYDDWNAVHCDIDERLIERAARAMTARGLAAAGYRYVTIDDCWSARSRSASPIRHRTIMYGTWSYHAASVS